MGESFGLLTSNFNPIYLLLLVLMNAYKVYHLYKDKNPPVDPLADLKAIVNNLAAAVTASTASPAAPSPAGSPPPVVAASSPPGTVQTMVPVTVSFQPKIHAGDPPTA